VRKGLLQVNMRASEVNEPQFMPQHSKITTKRFVFHR